MTIIKFMRRKRKILLIVLALLIFSSGCSIKDINLSSLNKTKKNTVSRVNSSKEVSNNQRDYIVLSMSNPSTLNPISNRDKSVEDILKLCYQGLITFDSSLKLSGGIADSWHYDENDKSFTVSLNQNAKWSDGSKITSDDVIYTINQILSYKNNSPYKQLLSNLSYCNPIDDSQIYFKLKVPSSNFIYNLFFPIISKKFYASRYFQTLTPSPSNGEYVLNDYDTSKECNLNYNNYYLGNAPKLKKIKVLITPDEDSKLNMFEEMQVDAIRTSPDNLVNTSSINTNNYKYPTDTFELLCMNNKGSILWDPNVRKAIAYAVNRYQIVNKLLIGKAIISDYPIIPNSYDASRKQLEYSYNTYNSKELLKKSGWVSAKNGTLYKKIRGGMFNLNLNFIVKYGDNIQSNTAAFICNYLKKVGIGTKIEYLNYNDYENRLINKKYDLALIKYGLGFDNDLSGLMGYGNILNYSNSDVTSDLELLNTQTDPEERSKSVQKVSKQYINDLPFYVLYFDAENFLTNKIVKSTKCPNFYSPYSEVENWSVK